MKTKALLTLSISESGKKSAVRFYHNTGLKNTLLSVKFEMFLSTEEMDFFL